ncbi:putative E3 ubiquitin ligase [Handroanthus impetiginosus]|uniref:Putative E3 ubiquitin ligase n=1 Tax=Handroanthus impetiginosus TaxID=429701 RepID=A0A2G9HRM5_9LAMI|nr:putative E3 ubiquitin ligase [Handroanthus impetiginosus]
MVGGSNNENANSSSFAKTICSICYEDLKPITEDLQSISICGHVFHELCLQQWFEYCPNVKKKNCPICKQSCTNANVARLYFQSISDPNDSSLSQKLQDYEENPEELRKEVIWLEGKVVALASTLEQQQKEFKEVKDQLFSCKEQLKVEVALKNEALTQTATSQQLLRMKSEELDRSTLERMRVQERNMALARELAALKLASDLNLGEDEVMKLASLGHDVGSKETVDILRKSLVIRNKSYKELMAKCNSLGRGEARCLRKLEKAKETINKLKLRVQELETAVEIKDNEALRLLKGQGIKFKTDSCENTMKRPANQIDLDGISGMQDTTFCSRKNESCRPMSKKHRTDDNSPGHTDDQNDQEKGRSPTNEDEDIVCTSTLAQGLLPENVMPIAVNDIITQGSHVPVSDESFDTQNDVEMLKSGNEVGGSCSLAIRHGRKEDQTSKLSSNVDDVVICYGDTNSIQTSLRIRKEITPSVPVYKPGSHCFSGGLPGPDGTNWHLGKWCKKAQNQGSRTLSAGLQGSNARAGDLIAVGADGRGGRIKVMRSLDQPSMDIKDTSSSAKRLKHVAKPNKLLPQGHLQIEHFFQRMGQ